MKTLKEIESLMTAYGLGSLYERLKSGIMSSIHIDLQPSADKDIPIGTSKMGGLPDLPKNVKWVGTSIMHVPLTFICQINFSEVKPYDVSGKLPDKGMLYFFYDCSEEGMPWGYDPKDKDGKAVYYYDGDMSKLERKKAPQEIEEDGIIFRPAKLLFDISYDLPNPDSTFFESLNLTGDEKEKYFDMLDDTSEFSINKLLGYSDNIQGSMELECELVYNGLYCGNSSGYEKGLKKGLDKNTSRWKLLLQIDSNEELGMMWGDCGRLYLWITEENLSKRNFSDSWVILQCG